MCFQLLWINTKECNCWIMFNFVRNHQVVFQSGCPLTALLVFAVCLFVLPDRLSLCTPNWPCSPPATSASITGMRYHTWLSQHFLLICLLPFWSCTHWNNSSPRDHKVLSNVHQQWLTKKSSILFNPPIYTEKKKTSYGERDLITHSW
jgi:hypothetical protein